MKWYEKVYDTLRDTLRHYWFRITWKLWSKSRPRGDDMKWYEKVYGTLWHYWFHITWKLWYSKRGVFAPRTKGDKP